jgi:hypothetical protein
LSSSYLFAHDDEILESTIVLLAVALAVLVQMINGDDLGSQKDLPMSLSIHLSPANLNWTRDEKCAGSHE